MVLRISTTAHKQILFGNFKLVVLYLHWCKAYTQLRVNECLDVRTLKTEKFLLGIHASKCFKDFPALLLCGLADELLIGEESSPALKDSGPEETFGGGREDVEVDRNCSSRFPKDCNL